MMKLIIGNKNYSSWSLRAWLAVKQSGLLFDEVVLSLYDDAWDEEKQRNPDLAPSAGKVPVLWHGDVVVWDSLAILDYLADKVGHERFWPKSDDARAMARSMVAEMHSGFMALRKGCTMNLRRRVEEPQIDAEIRADIVRILTLWAEARARYGRGGPYLFGAFGAADIAFAPIVGRFITYGIPVPGFAAAYIQAVWEHEWLQDWVVAAEAEPWVIARFETSAVG